MKAVMKLMTGAAGVAALVGMAAPAAAQYPYGSQSPYGYGYNTNPANVIGQVIGQVLNPYQNQYQNQYSYGYGANPQVAAQQCTAAVQQRLQSQYRTVGYGYSPYGYNNAYSQARVLGITRVEQRSRSTTRVRGYATSGRTYGGYGGYGGYGYAQAQAPADLIFRCDVDYRGYVRDIDIDRRD